MNVQTEILKDAHLNFYDLSFKIVEKIIEKTETIWSESKSRSYKVSTFFRNVLYAALYESTNKHFDRNSFEFFMDVYLKKIF